MKLSKRKKAIIFFGFYLFFFLILFSTFNQKKVIETNLETTDEKEKSYSILYFNNVLKLDDFQYNFEIMVDEEVLSYHGTKKDTDYQESEYQYFFDIFNINQLLKKSKVLEKIDNYGKYRLDNQDLDASLKTSGHTGNTIIEIKEDKELEIDIDLHEYYQKELSKIKLIFMEGDNLD